MTALPREARAQFTFASDNSGNSAYSDGWQNTDNGGTGFNAWSLSNGQPSGQFSGNYTTGTVNNGISGFTGGGAFMQYAKFNVDGTFAQADRNLSTGMGIGDVLSFQWGVNFDAGNANGAKGFNIYVGGTGGAQVINMNIGGNANITLNGTNVLTSYGTSAMTINIRRTSASSIEIWTPTGRNGGSGFTNTISGLSSSEINAFRFYTSRQEDGDNRNNAFNNFSSTNSGVFSQGGTVTNANTFTGAGNLSIGSSTTLALSGGGNNNYTGTTIISNGSTLRFQGSGTSDFVSAISGGGAIVVSNGNGQVNFKGNNTSFTGAITITNGTLEAWHQNALGGTGTGTVVGSGGALKLYTNSSGITFAAEPLTLNGTGISSGGALLNEGGNNTWAGLITLGSDARINAGTNTTLTLDVGSGNAITGTHNLTIGGNGTVTVKDNINISTAKLVKDGTGTLNLDATMTYTGNTEIDAGTLSLSANGALSTSSMVYLGSGSLGQDAALQLAGTSGFTNKLQVNSGSGSRTITKSDATSQTMSGVLTNNNSLYVSVGNSAGNLGVSGVISGSGGLVKQGAGTLSLSGNSTGFTGGIFVDAGVLTYSGGSLGTGTLGMGAESGGGDAATLRFGAADLTTSRNLEVRAGAGARLVSYTPTSGSSTLSGNITLSNSLAFNVASGGTLRFGGAVTPQASGNVRLALDGGGTLISIGNSTTTSANYQIRVGNGTLIIGSGALTARTGVGGIGHGYDLGVDLNNSIVDATSSILASNGVTVVSSIYVSSTNNRARVLGLTGAGAATFSGGIDLYNAGLTLTADNSSGHAIISGAIANFTGSTATSNTVTKTGAGTVTLSGNNSFGGVLTVAEGKLTVNTINNASANGVLGNSANAVVLGSSGKEGFLHYTGGTASSTKTFTAATGGTAGIEVSNAATTLTLSGAIGGSGAVTKGGAGVLLLSGNNTFGGTLSVHAGTLQIGSINNTSADGVLGNSGNAVQLGKSGTANTATLRYAGGTASSTKTFSLVSETNAAGVFEVDNSATVLTLSGAIGGAGRLQKTGAGTLVLAANNTYAGGTTLSAGTLRVGHAGALGGGHLTQTSGSSLLEIGVAGTLANTMSIYNVKYTAGSTLSGNLTLNNATFDVDAGVTSTNTGVLSGEGGVTKIGAGTLILAGSANNTYTGATVISNGGLVLSNSSGNAINASSGITVDGSSSQLVLGASNQIGDGIGLALDGGTFIVGNSTAGYAEDLGSLTLSSDSTIDFGSNTTNRSLTFDASNLISWSGALTISNWVQAGNGTNGAYGQLFFGNSSSGLTSGQLASISFDVSGTIYGAKILSSGEVVADITPIPEPRVYFGALAIVTAVGWRERKRLLVWLGRGKKPTV